jgi:hypothetical protein
VPIILSKEGKISYSFGYIKPLTLDETLYLMKQQRSIMCKCFFKYEKILQNQVNVIDSKTKEGQI